MIDYLEITVAAIVPLVLGGGFKGIMVYSEFKENKANVANTLKEIKAAMETHEKHDQERQQQVMERIGTAEQNILNVYRK